MKTVHTNNVATKNNVGTQRDPVNSLGWLGPIRMLVITFIAFGYASTMPRGPDQAEYLRMFGYDPSWYGINIIFIITGFLALRSLQRHRSPIKFLLSRIGRTIPILVLFTLIVILVLFPVLGIPPEAGNSRLEQHIQYFANVVFCIDPGEATPGLLDNALYHCIIQGGIWTFRWGAIAFLGTAVLWALGILKHKAGILALTLLLMLSFIALMAYGTRAQDPHAILDFLATGLRLGWAYMVGMSLYAFRKQIPRSFIISFGFIGFAGLNFFFLPWTPLIEMSVELGLGYICFLGITSQRPVPKWVRAVPDLSLGLYVFNWPVTQITLLLIPTLMPLSLFAIAFPLTIIISLCIWGLISRKINMKLEKKLAFS